MRAESSTSLSNISTFYVFELVKYQNTIQIYRKHSKESRLGLLSVRIDFSSVETVQWPKRLGAGWNWQNYREQRSGDEDNETINARFPLSKLLIGAIVALRHGRHRFPTSDETLFRYPGCNRIGRSNGNRVYGSWRVADTLVIYRRQSLIVCQRWGRATRLLCKWKWKN